MDQHNQCVFSSMDALAIPMGALVQLVEKIGLADIGCNFSLGLQYQHQFLATKQLRANLFTFKNPG